MERHHEPLHMDWYHVQRHHSPPRDIS
ncbi:hypothetical protein CFP56_021569 [Quercus suber]|uniref:Uncharacterized protein n=1 Tax=Quercus suber TaxID=58331 RepID=A0AAW0LZK9_QUESU